MPANSRMGFNSAFKGLNAELNPIRYLLALLGAHHFLHVSRIRVNADREIKVVACDSLSEHINTGCFIMYSGILLFIILNLL